MSLIIGLFVFDFIIDNLRGNLEFGSISDLEKKVVEKLIGEIFSALFFSPARSRQRRKSGTKTGTGSKMTLRQFPCFREAIRRA